MKVLTLSAAAKVDIDFLWLHGASALFFMTLRGFADEKEESDVTITGCGLCASLPSFTELQDVFLGIILNTVCLENTPSMSSFSLPLKYPKNLKNFGSTPIFVINNLKMKGIYSTVFLA